MTLPTWNFAVVAEMNSSRRAPPQAMNAAMLGITMLDKKVPNFCTWTRADERVRQAYLGAFASQTQVTG